MGLFNLIGKEKKEDLINSEMKIIDKDIGFAQDCFNLVKNLIAMETHCLNSYLSSKDEKWLKLMKEFREKRTFYLDKITSKTEGNGWCFIPQTKIITFGGINSINKIQISDEVLTHKNRFRKVVAVKKRYYEGELIEIKMNYTNIHLKVTPEHLFYVADNLRTPQKDLWKKNFKEPNFIWKEAQYLDRKDFIYLPRYQYIKDISNINTSYSYHIRNQFSNTNVLKESSYNISIDDTLLETIGLYLAEGHNSKNYMGFSFSRKEENLRDFILLSIIQHFGYTPHHNLRESTIEMSINKKAICNFFKQFGSYAHNKDIPSWVINLPYEKLYSLLRGMFKGDGSIDKYSFKYATVSEELAHKTRLVLNKIGVLSNISNKGKSKDSLINGRVIKSNYDVYTLSISGDSARRFSKLVGFKYNGGKKTSGQFAMVEEEYFLIPILSISKTYYKGEVYNLEVNEDQSYTTFNGTAHNCLSKHLTESSMLLQELSTRYMTINDLENAKRCAEDSGFCYEKFLDINGYLNGKSENNTSA